MNNKQTILKILDKHRDMSVDEALVKEMVNKFIGWKLPEDFHPDAGIAFRKEYNVSYNANQGKPPCRHEPVGTNLFTADQAEEMFRHLLADYHPATPLTLLKALEANYKPIKGRRETRTYHINGTYTVAFVDDITKESGVYEIKIPDVTTLTELPHTHKLWTDLLPILS